MSTEQKGTMRYADGRNGVTRQEKGGSKLSSVDFTQQQEEIEV